MEPANTNKEPILPKLEEFIWKYTHTNQKDASLSAVTLVQKDDPEIEKANQLLSSNEVPLEQSRAFGCFICSAIGDALGCYTEFSDRKNLLFHHLAINGFRCYGKIPPAII